MKKEAEKRTGKDSDVGVIHGRFQILHNDHVKYLLAGKKECHHLVVGITNPDPMRTKKEDCAPQRDAPAANPLTYYERLLLVNAAFEENNIPSHLYSVVPFPVNFPELYKYYVPMDARFFLTIYDNWGRKKKEYFESLGLNVHILWEVPEEKKGLSATDIRNCMISGNPWEHFVPESVAGLLKKWDVPKRLKT